MSDNYSYSSKVVARMEMLATHKWPDAPEHRSYLRNDHAHVFKFEGVADVRHDNRDIEFHDLRTTMYNAVAMIADHSRPNAPPTFGAASCEQIGKAVLEICPELSYISVSEDGQFDAIVIRKSKIKLETGTAIATPRRVYLASASKGDRELLRKIAFQITAGGRAMVFAPCLAFVGIETPELRPIILDICFDTIREWAEDLYILDEGIPSEGCNAERNLARRCRIPVFIVRPDGTFTEEI